MIGSGPNGLAAAIVLAQAGHRVVVFEAQPAIGGGVRSAELDPAGFRPRRLLGDSSLRRRVAIFPNAPAGPPWPRMDRAARHAGASLRRWNGCGRVPIRRAHSDRAGRRRRALPGVDAADRARLVPARSIGARPSRVAEAPVRLASLACRRFDRPGGSRAVPSRPSGRGPSLPASPRTACCRSTTLTAGFGLVLGAMAHVAGWVFPRGGAQNLTNALAAHLPSLGGEIRTGSLSHLSRGAAARARGAVRSVAEAVSADRGASPAWRYRRKLEAYRYGMGAFKVDWALDGPIPWRDRECALAATVHLGGTLDEIVRSEAGRVDRPERREALRDPGSAHALRSLSCAGGAAHRLGVLPRAARLDGRHAAEDRTADRTVRSRFPATPLPPRYVLSPDGFERRNPNFVGGDIAAGVTDMTQFFARPTLSAYSTPVEGLYLCSAATPPGVGVHGMCGYFAARRALKEVLCPFSPFSHAWNLRHVGVNDRREIERHELRGRSQAADHNHAEGLPWPRRPRRSRGRSESRRTAPPSSSS